MSDAIVEKGKPLNLEEIADKELVKALLDHHTEGQCKCIQHVMYRYNRRGADKCRGKMLAAQALISE